MSTDARTNGVPPTDEPPVPFARRIVTADVTWLTDEPPPREYLAIDSRTDRGALDAQGVALLAAAGGVGKSYTTIALALAVATGGAWLGTFRVRQPGRVLIVSAEEPTDEIRRRVYRVARASGVTWLEPSIDVLDLHDVHAPLLDADGNRTGHAYAFQGLVRERGPYALVIVDPLGRLAGAPIDKDNVAAAALVSVLEAVSTAARGLVLAVHHTDKLSRRLGLVDATAVRGATGLSDYVRMVMMLGVEDVKGLGEIVTLSRAKANHVSRWEPVELRRGEYGELIPLSAEDREAVKQARGKKKRPQTEGEREDLRVARERDEGVRRAKRAADGARADAERCAREDEAARAILDAYGDQHVTSRDWYAEMRNRLGKCSTGRADAARKRVERERGPT